MEKTKDDTMEFDITEEEENVLLNDINKLEDQKVGTKLYFLSLELYQYQ